MLVVMRQKWKDNNVNSDNNKSDDKEGSIVWLWVILLLGFYIMYLVVMGLMSGEMLGLGANNMSPVTVFKEDSPKYYWASIIGYTATSVWLIYVSSKKILARQREC